MAKPSQTAYRSQIATKGILPVGDLTDDGPVNEINYANPVEAAPILSEVALKDCLSELVTFCGTACEVQIPLKNMKPHIGYFAREAVRIVKTKGDESIPTLSPYIGRGLLESTLTALLFRLDPFRGLTLMRFQTHNDFDHNRPNNISIDWNGDLVSDVEERADIWKPKRKPENVSRGLLSPYMDEVIWRPALSAANDSLSAAGEKCDFPHRLGKDPDDFINGIRGEARQLYSFWSKGIHGEFFAIGPHTLDEITCADRIRRTVDILLDLAFVSQFSYVSVGNIDPGKAYQLFSSAKENLHG